MNIKSILITMSVLPILACSNDPNSEPKYGDSGLIVAHIFKLA